MGWVSAPLNRWRKGSEIDGRHCLDDAGVAGLISRPVNQANSSLRLVGRDGDLLISIDSRSWHVLDEPDLFPEGAQLLRAFGITWAEPPFGILKRIPASQFRQSCERVWQPLLRDQELLSYSYQYELQREKGVSRGNMVSGIFHVRGLAGSIKTTPKGFSPLRQSDIIRL